MLSGQLRDRSEARQVVAGQRAASPVHGGVGEQPVLDVVPLRGARRHVADRDVRACLGGRGCGFGFPGAGAVAVGAACIGGDQQTCGLRVVVSATIAVALRAPGPRSHGPCRRAAAAGPAPRNGEGSGVVVGADAGPSAVRGDVVHPVRDRLAWSLPVQEVVRLDRYRLALGPPLTPGVLVAFSLWLLAPFSAPLWGVETWPIQQLLPCRNTALPPSPGQLRSRMI